MTITLYPYDPNGSKYDYSFAKSIRVIENGKTYEIIDQGHRTHWFSVKDYSMEVKSMEYIRKEDIEKVLNNFDGKRLTLETQQEIHDFMTKEKTSVCNFYGISKKLALVLAKMKLTANNPDNSPNWANTLPDNSQIVWNRKHQEFYHLESHGVTNCSSSDWLLDNMSNLKFVQKMGQLLKYFAGKYDEWDRLLTL